MLRNATVVDVAWYFEDMQDANKVAIEVVEDDYDDLVEVDSKLMRLALDKQWKLMTNDFNLNKVGSCTRYWSA